MNFLDFFQKKSNLQLLCRRSININKFGHTESITPLGTEYDIQAKNPRALFERFFIEFNNGVQIRTDNTNALWRTGRVLHNNFSSSRL